eukprot:1155705-Pelagomonas_calceolata.AAC.3
MGVARLQDTETCTKEAFDWPSLKPSSSLSVATLFAITCKHCLSLSSHAASGHLHMLLAGDLVLKTPRLLTQQPRAMSENLKGLAAELGIARESASVLCTQQPSLLILSNNMLKQRIMVSEMGLIESVSSPIGWIMLSRKSEVLNPSRAEIEAPSFIERHVRNKTSAIVAITGSGETVSACMVKSIPFCPHPI